MEGNLLLHGGPSLLKLTQQVLVPCAYLESGKYQATSAAELTASSGTLCDLLSVTKVSSSPSSRKPLQVGSYAIYLHVWVHAAQSVQCLFALRLEG